MTMTRVQAGMKNVATVYFGCSCERLRVVLLLLATTGAGVSIGDGLKQYWPLNDGTGSVASNAVAGGNAGTLANFSGGGWDVDVPAPLASRASGSLAFTSASSTYVNGGHLGMVATGGVDGVSLSLWLKPGVIGSDTRLISMLRQTSTTPHPTGAVRLVADGAGNGTLQVSSTSWNNLSTVGAIRTNQWQHLCLVWRGNLVDAYLNGNLIGSATAKFEYDRDSNGAPIGFGIGARYLTSGTYFQGKLADVAVWQETLSPVHVRRLAAGESPITIHAVDAEHVQPLCWALDDGAGLFATNSVLGGSTAALVNAGGAAWDTDVPEALVGRSSGSLRFNTASNTYLNGGYLGISSTGGVDGVTLSVWLKPTAVGDARLFSTLRKTAVTPNPSGNVRLATNALGKVILQVATNTVWLSLTPAGAIQTNEWQHLSLVWRANYVEAFVNGERVGWVIANFEFDRDSNGDSVGFGIGAKYLSTYGQTFDGKLDDLAVWNWTLSASQIGALATGVSPLAVSLAVSPLRPEKPLVQYRLDGDATALPRLYDGAVVNGATFANSAGDTPFTLAGNKALSLDGVNDEVTLPNLDALRPGTNAWTVSLWFKASASDQRGAILANRLSVYPYTQIGIYCGGATLGNIGTGRRIHYVVLGGAVGAWEAVSSTDYADGAWHHVALVCESNYYPPILHIDGSVVPVSVLRSPTGPTDINSANPWRIGSAGLSGYYFSGMVDEVAMWNAALPVEQVAWLANNSLTTIPPRGTLIRIQ